MVVGNLAFSNKSYQRKLLVLSLSKYNVLVCPSRYRSSQAIVRINLELFRNHSLEMDRMLGGRLYQSIIDDQDSPTSMIRNQKRPISSLKT